MTPLNLEQAIVNQLRKKSWTVTTAESCTGGLLAGRLLNAPGASDIYMEGHITYSNESKERLLGVAEETISRFGAVSKETAGEMAEGAARAAHAQIAVSTTGIAGPGGGTKDKPVGLVYIGCYICGEIFVEECHFDGCREENRSQAVEKALQLLLGYLTDEE